MFDIYDFRCLKFYFYSLACLLLINICLIPDDFWVLLQVLRCLLLDKIAYYTHRIFYPTVNGFTIGCYGSNDISSILSRYIGSKMPRDVVGFSSRGKSIYHVMPINLLRDVYFRSCLNSYHRLVHKKEGFVFLYESLLSFNQSYRLIIYSFKFTFFVELKLNVVG